MSQTARPSQPGPGQHRVACAQPCSINDGKLIRSGAIWNMSAGGVYLVVKAIPSVGNYLSVSFVLPGEIEPVTAATVVAWRNAPSDLPGRGASAPGLPPGCGLRFVGLSTDDRRRIENRVRSSVSWARKGTADQ